MIRKVRNKSAARRGTTAHKRRGAAKSAKRPVAKRAASRRRAPARRKTAVRKKKPTFVEKMVAKAGKALDALVEASPPPAALSKTYPL